MADIFMQAMKKLSMFKADAQTIKLSQAISDVTGLSLASIAQAERQAVARKSFRPLRQLLENAHASRVNRLKYRVGLKQARKRSRSMGEILANKIELTITTERGAVYCEADIYVISQTSVMGQQRQTVNIDIRYSIYRGLKKEQYRQNLKLTSKPRYEAPVYSPEWTTAA